MRITIAQRFKPFSHIPGTYFLLPGTTLRFQIFPALIRVHDLIKEPKLIQEIPLAIQGPVEGFTVQQDLEKGEICVWGNAANGYMRYRIRPHSESFVIHFEKQPEGLLWANPIDQPTPLLSTERLSLGSHKKQDWERMRASCDMTDIFPLWFRLGQMIPQVSNEGNDHTLLAACRNTRDLAPFQHLFMAGFEGGLSPRLKDTDFQGFAIPTLNSDSSLPLITEGSALIRQLFIREEKNEIFILPLLPIPFHCGRALSLKCEHCLIDLEWSKKLIRRMIVKPLSSSSNTFRFQHALKRFRLRKSNTDRGHYLDCNTPIMLEEGLTLYFDNFQK